MPVLLLIAGMPATAAVGTAFVFAGILRLIAAPFFPICSELNIIAATSMARWVMPTIEPKTEPDNAPESTVPEASGKRGCPASFLLQKKGEMDRLCGGAGGDVKEEYVQPDAEKESGGEG